MEKPPEIISYYTMRRAIGVLGITLPLILVAGSSLFGDCKEVQLSISTYYYTNMRNIFVGFNCAVALFLIVYALLLFPKTQMDRTTGVKMFMGRQKKKRNVVYYICGGVMTVSLILILAYMWFLGNLYPGLKRLDPIFWLESILMFSFGISWLTKGQLLFRDDNYRKGP